MLTLTRKPGESIVIGGDIEIVVKEIRRNQVRLGIVAPKDVPIYREEIVTQQLDNYISPQPDKEK